MADPKYRDIANDLRRMIESGELAPGDRLPNEMEFCERYDASRNTIRDALKWLAIRGLVETRVGQGRFVTLLIEPIITTLSEDPETGLAGGEGKAAFVEIIKQRERRRQAHETAGRDTSADHAAEPETREVPDGEPHASVPTIEVKFAPDHVAERLRVPTGAEVVLRHQEFYIGRTPWSLQTTFYPMELVERGASALLRAQDFPDGAVKYIEEKLGVVQCGYRTRILVRPPNQTEARFFRLPEDGRVPVVSLIRTGYTDTEDQGPHPFRVTFTVLPADRHQFVINSGNVPEELAAPARDQ